MWISFSNEKSQSFLRKLKRALKGPNMNTLKDTYFLHNRPAAMMFLNAPARTKTIWQNQE